MSVDSGKLLFLDQPTTEEMSSWKSSCSSRLSTYATALPSLAKSHICSYFKQRGRSLINAENNKGPTAEPCITQDVTLQGSKHAPLYTVWLLFCKKFEIHLTTDFPCLMWHSLLISFVWGTLSNAFLKSIKITS